MYNIYRLSDSESSALNFSTSLSNLSRQPLPFRCTGLAGVEKLEPSTAAVSFQSESFEGLRPTTSLAR